MSATSFSNDADCFKALSDDFRIKILLDNGLLIQRKDAVWNIYSLNQKHFSFLSWINCSQRGRRKYEAIRILTRAILPVLEGISLR
jgi:hypothetical protein